MLDPEIREALFYYLDCNYGKHRTFEETPINSSRSDIFAVTENGLIGFEIKSDADSYTRLNTQVKNYDIFYDFNYLVIGGRHIKGAQKHIPDYWGIICVSEGGIEVLKPHAPNPKVKLKKQLELLWKSELSHIQARQKLPKYAQKSKAFIRTKLIEKVPEALLKMELYEELFERDYTLK